MALPAHTASLLSKLGLVDVVIGLVMAIVGFTSGPELLRFAGLGLMGCGGYLAIWARSQRPKPEGPIDGGPIL